MTQVVQDMWKEMEKVTDYSETLSASFLEHQCPETFVNSAGAHFTPGILIRARLAKEISPCH